MHPKSWTQNPTERSAVFITKYMKEERKAAAEAVLAGDSIPRDIREFGMSASELSWTLQMTNKWEK